MDNIQKKEKTGFKAYTHSHHKQTKSSLAQVNNGMDRFVDFIYRKSYSRHSC